MAAVPEPTTYDDLLARVRALVTASERVPVVGITGHGGAGKSTLAERLAADLGVAEDQIVATDALYAATCGPGGGMWDQLDWLTLEGVIAKARRGDDRLRYGWRWYTGETGTVDQPMPLVLIVEGIRLIRQATRDWFDLTVWLDMDAETAGARAVARNVEQGDAETELDLWRTKWIPEGHEYQRLERPQQYADMVLTAPGVPRSTPRS